MTTLGLDIGGTKIACASYDDAGTEIAQISMPTPPDYEAFLQTCRRVVEGVEKKGRAKELVGVGICGFLDRVTHLMTGSPNIPYLVGKPFERDLARILGRKVAIENDANCAALAEALEGPGKGYESVFGLIVGTGVGGGFVQNGRIVSGANGMCGEIGHLPLPCYEESDGAIPACGCGRKGCVEPFISGAGLARLYQAKTGRTADAKQIGTLARQGDAGALSALDQYYTLFAKAMTVILHSFDPDIIIVSGGLNALPGLYDEVPKRWGPYALCKTPLTRFLPASLGPMAGLRGAALLGRS